MLLFSSICAELKAWVFSMKEYGSFFELDLRKGNEYYNGDNVKRLNTARCGIYYILKLLRIKKIILPFYQCKTVSDFLLSKGIEISYAYINENLKLEPPPKVEDDTAILVVNYFGLLSKGDLEAYTGKYKNVIIDNSQAFFKRPINLAYTVYSPRKFFGVADGCYVIGEKAGRENFPITQNRSSDTSLFLFERIEKKCEQVYASRQKSEARLDMSGMKGMPELTRALLDNIDYIGIKEKRLQNFIYAKKLFKDINLLDLDKFKIEEDTIPMIYPLVLKDEGIIDYLVKNKVFIGRWWRYLTEIMPEDSIEMFLSKYLLPLPIDQRMDTEDIEKIYQLIIKY